MRKAPRGTKRRSNKLYGDYIQNCKRGNIFFGLDIEDFYRLTKRICTYCKRPPHRVREGWTYNGLDRLNPKFGYTLDNVVPCCFTCNGIKSNKLTHSQMRKVGKILMSFWKRTRQKD